MRPPCLISFKIFSDSKNQLQQEIEENISLLTDADKEMKLEIERHDSDIKETNLKIESHDSEFQNLKTVIDDMARIKEVLKMLTIF